MSQCYDSLMRVKGVPELKQVFAQWQKLSDNIKKTGTDRINILPDMLWISENGINKTELLSLMSDYLYELGNLMSFSSEKRFIEFSLVREGNGSDFTELTRLNTQINAVKGYRNSFEGVIYIDISEWADHTDDWRFLTFLEFLATNSSVWLIILNVDRYAVGSFRRLESVLSSYLRIHKVRLEAPSTEEYFNYALSILDDYGFVLDGEARGLLRESLSKMRKSKRFDGVGTVRYLCSDIIYRSLSRETEDLYALSAKDLSGFSADSEYVSHIIESGEKRERSRIGFGGGSDND